LVLGATSLIGRFALPGLAAEGRTVFAVSRKAGPREAGLHWVHADVCASGLILPPARAALSLSPIWLLPHALPALKRAGVERLVAFSSTSRFTKADSTEAEEREVARRLADGEKAVAEFCEAERISWTVLRPTLIYAEGYDSNVSRLARWIARFGVFPLAGEGAGRRQPVHAEDLARLAIAALGRGECANASYDLPGGRPSPIAPWWSGYSMAWAAAPA
jgi:nucleoside-diphosphate-sugar epimerase